MKEMIYCPGTNIFGVELDLECPTDGWHMYDHLKRSGLEAPYKTIAIGCGMGCVVNCLREKGVEAYGIDTRNVFPKDKNFFIWGDARQIPFPDATFDVTSDHNTLSYLINIKQDEPKAIEILKEMHRVLKPKGFIYSNFLGCSEDSHGLRKTLYSLDYEPMNKNKNWPCYVYKKLA